MKTRTVASIATCAIALAMTSPFGAVAQGEAPESADTEVLFVTNGSEFSSFAGTPAGAFGCFSFNWTHEPGDYGAIGGSCTCDPAPHGGDTFDINTSAKVTEALESGTWIAEGSWNVLTGSGSGEYEGLRGRGEVLVVTRPNESRTAA